MPLNKLLLSCLICLIALPSLFALANDSSIGDDNGSISFKFQPDISMDKEALFLSEKNIRVDYIFMNNSQHDVDVPIAFPMPPIYFGPMDHTEIKDFKLWVNDHPQQTETKLVVLLDEHSDISDQMAQSGWTIAEVASFIQSGQRPKGKKPLPTEWFDDNGEPRFIMSHYYIWQQHFPAGEPVAIRHSYTPSVASGVPQSPGDIIEWYAKDACLDQSTRSAINKRGSEYGVNWAELRYILTTANNWQGAIKDFHLTIKKQYPTDVISLCFAGTLQKTDPLTFEFRQKNFIPSHDLELLFVRRFK